MKKKIIISFLTLFFFLFQSETSFTQTKNTIIISVGNYPVTRLDLLKEIKLIAILSNTQINNDACSNIL